MQTFEIELFVLQFVYFLLAIRKTAFSYLSARCSIKTSNLKRSLCGSKVETRANYIPCIVAILRLTKAETDVLIEYAGVYREYEPRHPLVLCCRDIHSYLDENDNYATENQIVTDLNGILKKYGFPLISE